MGLVEARAMIDRHRDVLVAVARALASYVDDELPAETKARLEAMLAREDVVVDWHERQFELRAPDDPVRFYINQTNGDGRMDALIVDGDEAWDVVFEDVEP